MDANYADDLCLGVWKKRENCYEVEHYDLVFKKREDVAEGHGILFQPDECTWHDTLVCPGVVKQEIERYDEDVRRMMEIAEHTKREMIRLGYADESDDEEYEDVDEDAPPPVISLPPSKTPKKVRQKAVRANTRTTLADEDVPSSSIRRSPRESVSVEINALLNVDCKSSSNTTTKLKKVMPSKTKKHREAAAAKKIASQPDNDVEEEVVVESPPDVAKLVDYHEKVISTKTPAVAPHSSKPIAMRKTSARRILEEEREDDEPDTTIPEGMETEDCGDDDEPESDEDEFLRNEMKRTTCMVDLSKDNLLLEGAGDHGQPSNSREDSEEVMMNDSLDEEDCAEEEDEDEDVPLSETKRSLRRSGRRLSGYAYSKKKTRERARSYRKSAVAKTMNEIPEDEDEEDQHEEVVKTREEEEAEPGCSSWKTTAPSQATSSVSGKDGLRKRPKRKPPVAGGTRKFNKKLSTKSSFGSTTERFITPTKGTGAVASTPSSSKKRVCMTPVSTKKHRGTLSYLNRSTGASRLRRAGDKTSATPIKTPIKYNLQTATIVKSFVQRNTPEKSLTKEAHLEAKKKMLEKKEIEERERKIRIEEEKKMQIADTKRKREERARKANENRELNDQRRAEELKLKNEREEEKQARIEAKRKEDMEKKKLHDAKANLMMTDKADKKRKHDNEKIDLKRQKMEGDAANEKKEVAKAEKAKQREEERLRKMELKKEKAEKIRNEKELRLIARNKAREDREAEVIAKKEAEEKRRAEELTRERKEEEEERKMELYREGLRKKRQEELRKVREEALRKKRDEEHRKKTEEELYKRQRDEEIQKRREDERKRLEKERKQLEIEKERQRMEEDDESMSVQNETESDSDESEPDQVVVLEEFKTPTAPRKPDSTSTPLLNETYNLSEQDTSSVTQYNMTPAGPDKLRLASTKEDYNIHDLDSGDSTDEEDAPRKKVPSWASGFEFKKAMRRQCVTNPTSIPALFPDARLRATDVDLNVLFRKNRPRYNKRTSSACWSPKGPGHVSFQLTSD